MSERFTVHSIGGYSISQKDPTMSSAGSRPSTVWFVCDSLHQYADMGIFRPRSGGPTSVQCEANARALARRLNERLAP